MHNYFKFRVIELNRDEISKIKIAWENAFVPVGIDREKIHYDCMRWHIFSYKVKECEKGEQAIDSFKASLNDSFYIFYQHKDTGYLIDNSTRAFIFDDMSIFITDFETSDIFITDKGYNWTFVQTHEDGWLGPYFCKSS